MGDEFVRGWAAVAPVDYKKACEYCDLAALCRIDDTGAEAEEESP